MQSKQLWIINEKHLILPLMEYASFINKFNMYIVFFSKVTQTYQVLQYT